MPAWFVIPAVIGLAAWLSGCDDGQDGVPGERGPVGSRGPDGETGNRGLRGPEGSPGTGCEIDGTILRCGEDSFDLSSLAIQGEPGPEGPEGSEGPEGPSGLTGSTGPVGPGMDLTTCRYVFSDGESFSFDDFPKNVNAVVSCDPDEYMLNGGCSFSKQINTGEGPVNGFIDHVSTRSYPCTSSLFLGGSPLDACDGIPDSQSLYRSWYCGLEVGLIPYESPYDVIVTGGVGAYGVCCEAP
jgi:hypothetical protein